MKANPLFEECWIAGMPLSLVPVAYAANFLVPVAHQRQGVPAAKACEFMQQQGL